jgi:diacylglycerol kinase family enzyme
MTNMAQQKLNEMQKQMEEMQRKQQQAHTNTPKKAQQVDGDYIDYEEVK